jgi:hypothetical protein
MDVTFYPDCGKMQVWQGGFFMRLRLLPGIAMLLLLALTACTLFQPLSKQRKAALDDFMYALRWHRHTEAAEFFTDEHRGDFLDQLEKFGKDLSITDVRLQRLDVADDGHRAVARLEMDYFLLPSVSLKTLRIDQTWVYFKTGDTEYYGLPITRPDGFLITTPFPEIPGESSRGKGALPP